MHITRLIRQERDIDKLKKLQKYIDYRIQRERNLKLLRSFEKLLRDHKSLHNLKQYKDLIGVGEYSAYHFRYHTVIIAVQYYYENKTFLSKHLVELKFFDDLRWQMVIAKLVNEKNIPEYYQLLV